MENKVLPDYCFPGRELSSVDGVILHYFSCKNVDPGRMFDLEACRNLFLDLNAPKAKREHYMTDDRWPDDRMYASAHVLIGRDGEAWRLVPLEKEAYHAGASILNGRSRCNQWTLGVELVGHQSSGFTDRQYRRLAELLDDLQLEHGFPSDNVAGHDRVRWAAIQDGSRKRPKYDPSGRKDGNGDNFDWPYLERLFADRAHARPGHGESAESLGAG